MVPVGIEMTQQAKSVPSKKIPAEMECTIWSRMWTRVPSRLPNFHDEFTIEAWSGSKDLMESDPSFLLESNHNLKSWLEFLVKISYIFSNSVPNPFAFSLHKYMVQFGYAVAVLLTEERTTSKNGRYLGLSITAKMTSSFLEKSKHLENCPTR